MNTATPAPHRRKRWFWAIAAAALVAAVVAWILSPSPLERAIRDLKAAGYATSLAELAPPPAADADNAAPVYMAAFENLPPYPADYADSDSPFIKAYVNGFGTLVPQEKQAIRDWLQSHTGAFADIARARRLPRCRFNRDYRTLVTSLSVNEMSNAKKAQNALLYRALSSADAGNTGDVREALLDMRALADAFREDPLLLSQLVRIRCHEIMLDALDKCVTSDTSPDVLEMWAAALPPDDHFNGVMDRALRDEIAWAADELRTSRSPGSGASSWIQSRLIAQDAPAYLNRIPPLIAICEKPYFEIREQLAVMEKGDESGLAFLRPLTGKNMPLPGTIVSMTRLRARLTLLRTGLEWERTFKTTGRYPARVDVIDPCTGKTLLQRPEMGLLYSAGINGVDDGGVNEDGYEAEDDIPWKLRQHKPPAFDDASK
jgi:hypothetical protein